MFVYSFFSTANIATKNVIAQSSPVRRVMETSESVLAGLFTPRSDQMWSNSSQLATLWQPIQVTTESIDESYVLGDAKMCPVADELSDQTNSLPQMQQLWNESQDFVQRLSQYIGINITNIGAIGSLYDTLFCEQDYFGANFQQPVWLDQVGPDTMNRMSVFNQIDFKTSAWLGKQYLRLKAGPFLKEISQNMNITANDIGNNNRKFYAYGSHDSVIARILNALGFYTGLFFVVVMVISLFLYFYFKLL